MNNLVFQSTSQQLSALLDKEKVELLKNTICKGSTDEEFQLFLHACQRTGLDPFAKQIHAVKRPEKQKDGSYREAMSIQIGIDGFRLIADRTGRFCPGREPTFAYDKDGRLLSATAYVKKQTKDGTWHEIPATAFYLEYCQKTREGRPTKFWDNMPHSQLAKCAEALALRKAFPAELSGMYTKEEMEQSEIGVLELNPKQSENKVSQNLVNELSEILNDCSPEYQQSVSKFLERSNISSMHELTHETYKKLRDAALKRKSEFASQRLQIESQVQEPELTEVVQ